MEDRKKRLASEAFDAFERVRPILEEYFDNWVLTGHRAGCGTKIILGDICKGPSLASQGMQQQHDKAKEWKAIPLGNAQ
jgi:hypothetical protein